MSRSKSRIFKRSGQHPHPTRLLLTAREMELTLAKERMRCDRHSLYFSLLVFHLRNTEPAHEHRQVRSFAKILQERLRLTDERGMLVKGGIGVMLPMTGAMGARMVLDDLVELAHQKGIQLDASVYTYTTNEDDDSPSNCSEDIHSHHIKKPNDEDTLSGDSNDDIANGDFLPARNETQSLSSISVTRDTELHRIVRADNESQRRIDLATSDTDTPSPLAYLAPKYPKWKRAVDIVGASIGLIVASPILIGAAIAIKLTSKGPVFFRQMRTGQHGKGFAIYKLRTMVVNAEELKALLLEKNERDGPAFKMQNDPRVTRLGRFLRKTGIDELPQLWNVLIGDMSIVGPRPLPCHEDAQCLTWHRRRLDTKPGLTCIWQISKSRKVSFEEWMRMDLRYSDSRSFLHDISLMFRTAMAVFLGRVGH